MTTVGAHRWWSGTGRKGATAGSKAKLRRTSKAVGHAVRRIDSKDIVSEESGSTQACQGRKGRLPRAAVADECDPRAVDLDRTRVKYEVTGDLTQSRHDGTAHQRRNPGAFGTWQRVPCDLAQCRIDLYISELMEAKGEPIARVLDEQIERRRLGDPSDNRIVGLAASGVSGQRGPLDTYQSTVAGCELSGPSRNGAATVRPCSRESSVTVAVSDSRPHATSKPRPSISSQAWASILPPSPRATPIRRTGSRALIRWPAT